jgi:hypothetical protein
LPAVPIFLPIPLSDFFFFSLSTIDDSFCGLISLLPSPSPPLIFSLAAAHRSALRKKIFRSYLWTPPPCSFYHAPSCCFSHARLILSAAVLLCFSAPWPEPACCSRLRPSPAVRPSSPYYFPGASCSSLVFLLPCTRSAAGVSPYACRIHGLVLVRCPSSPAAAPLRSSLKLPWRPDLCSPGSAPSPATDASSHGGFPCVAPCSLRKLLRTCRAELAPSHGG